MLDARLEVLQNADIKFKDAVKKSIDDNVENNAFARLCEAHGYPYFDDGFASNQWEASFISDMRMALTEGRLLSDRQASTLLKIVNRQSDSATEKQINYLRRLGYTGDYALLTKKTASVEIDLLRRNNNE